MLSKKEAFDKALEIYNDYRLPDLRRLDRIDRALQPLIDNDGNPKGRIELPDDAPEILHRLTAESETNYLPLVLDTYAQIMIVDGYVTKSSGRDPWETWQRNKMDSRQTSLHRSVLAYGTAYASAVPGRTDAGEDYAATRLYSPRNMTAVYNDVEWDEWPVWALFVGATHWELFGPGESHRFGMEKHPQLFNNPLQQYVGDKYLTYLEPQEHDMDVPPIVRYQDRHYLADEKVLGIIEPLMTVQRRIDRTSANQMVAQQIAIFKQKYVVGWVPENEEEELKASLAKVHYLDMDPSEVQLGEWSATEIDPYINAGNQGRRDLAAIGQLPSQALGIDGISNISDATLAGLEAAKNRRAGTITTCIGESHEQLLRLYAHIDGNEEAARDFSSEVLWRELESRSYGGTIDGLVKLVGVGLPSEIAMEDVPGMTGQKLARVKRAMQREKIRSDILASRSAAAAPAAEQPGNRVDEPGLYSPPGAQENSSGAGEA